MIKHIIGYGLSALLIFAFAISWHNKDKEVDALTKTLESERAIAKKKKDDRDKEILATFIRDETYEQIDYNTEETKKQIVHVKKDPTVRQVLNTVVPPSALLRLCSYSRNVQTDCPKPSLAPSSNPGKP